MVRRIASVWRLAVMGMASTALLGGCNLALGLGDLKDRPVDAAASDDVNEPDSGSDATTGGDDAGPDECSPKCTGGMTCQGGGCACPGGTHDCNGVCSSNTSTASCGATSCSACAVPANGSATCSGSACGISCGSGFTECGGDSCVDETRNGNCGGCGVSCAIRCTTSACVTATTVATGFEYVCASLSDGSVECWGNNGSGQLGYTCPGGSAACSSPMPVPGVSGAIGIAAPGGADHTCAVLSSGQVMCWGANASGQLGYASSDSCTTGVCSKSAHAVPGISTAVAVATGRLFSCALLSNHTVQCWGDNSLGELGDHSQTSSTTPVTVSNLTSATAIVADSYAACALRSDGTVVCWGDDSADELGSAPASCDPSGDMCSLVPVQVANITHVTAITAAGSTGACALIGGNVECWGDLAGGLGDQAGTVEAYLPVSVWSVGNAIAIGGGYGSACAVLSGGTAVCWGQAPLGDGTTIASPTRVTVTGLSNAVSIAEGGETCAILSTGGISCFGSNGQGELGNGTTTPSYTMTPVVW